jgi:hypothetical protein
MTRSKKNRRTAPSEDSSNLVDTNAINPDHERAEEKVLEAQIKVAQAKVEERKEVGEHQTEVAVIKVKEEDIAESSVQETPVDDQSGHPSKMLKVGPSGSLGFATFD